MAPNVMVDSKGSDAGSGLTAYLSMWGAAAFAIGAAVGWGSLVVTSSTYLASSGPLGSVLGLFAGLLIMLVIAWNYRYMIVRYPSAGGSYTYVKESFGHDHGFLVSWFLVLTYIAMLWANATSIPLFARIFFGDIFQVGHLYTVFGYEVYVGEVLLTMAVVAIVAFVCMRSKLGVARLMVCLAAVFVIVIVVCSVAAFAGLGNGAGSIEPLFAPGGSEAVQVIYIACISSWAFIGFESISHSSEEFAFPRSKSLRILAGVAVLTTVLYACVTLLSCTAFPAEYGSWADYIADLGNLDGIEALPAFYAANHYLGAMGVYALMAALLSLVVTSIIANFVSLSRLLYALACDSVAPKKLSSLNGRRIPQNAILAVMAISLVIPFVGRTAIGWIVDVTVLGATIVYGFVSAAVFKVGRSEGSAREMATGAIGCVVMVVFGLLVLVPTPVQIHSMATESYILISVWAVLGFLYFRFVLQRDNAYRYGKSTIVWLALLFIVFFTSMSWMNEADSSATQVVSSEIQEYYGTQVDGDAELAEQHDFVDQKMRDLTQTKTVNTLFVMSLFAVALVSMLGNLRYMTKREEDARRKLDIAKSAAYIDSMTGVKSKHAYSEWEAEADENIRRGTAGAFAIIVCDVNGLKYVNDTYGHKAGDRYIRQASSLVCMLFKHSPVYRVGGDEFVVVVDDEDYAERDGILRSFDQQVEANLLTGAVVVSAGMSLYRPGEDASVHDVFERADQLMYARKAELKSKGARTR